MAAELRYSTKRDQTSLTTELDLTTVYSGHANWCNHTQMQTVLQHKGQQGSNSITGQGHKYALELEIPVIDSNQFSRSNRMPVEFNLSGYLQSQCQQCVPVGNKTGANCVILLFNKRLCYCRGTTRHTMSVEMLWPFFTELLTRSSTNPAHCQLNSCKMLHKCSTDCMWKRLQPVYDLQGHSRSLPLPPFDRPYTISY